MLAIAGVPLLRCELVEMLDPDGTRSGLGERDLDGGRLTVGQSGRDGGDGGDATSCSTTANARATGKPMWASENGSQDQSSGTPALIRSITRGYLDATMTAYLNWPLIAAITPNLPYATVGLMTAGQPWSGQYRSVRVPGPPRTSPSSPSRGGSS